MSKKHQILRQSESTDGSFSKNTIINREAKKSSKKIKETEKETTKKKGKEPTKSMPKMLDELLDNNQQGFYTEKYARAIDLYSAELDELIDIPGIDEENCLVLTESREKNKMVFDFAKKGRPGYKILTEEIQFDVGLLARKEMTLYYNGFKIDLSLIERLKYESKNDMYPEVSEYILQKVLTCPKCLKTHNHFSNFKDSCLKTCLNNKFPIYKSIKKLYVRGRNARIKNMYPCSGTLFMLTNNTVTWSLM